MKDINTLVKDIYGVLEGDGGWDTAVADHFNTAVDNLMDSRLNADGEYKPSIRMSNVGTPCARKLWYHTHATKGAPLRGDTRLKFMYGDVIEELVLSLAEAAGHNVVGRQDLMECAGIKGHRDGVIDGMLIDVKSASPYSFKKFAEHGLRKDDPFGYMAQLTAYLLSSQDDPLVTNKTHAAFLVMDKVSGEITLDTYDLREDMKRMVKLIEDRKAMVAKDTPPRRQYDEVPEGKSGNKIIQMPCGYCEFKNHCWPGLRTFVYYGGKPKFFTKVVKEPRVPEIK
jgi:hypothetical protein